MEALLTPIETAALLRISLRTLYTWTETGQIPAIKVGTRWRYSRDEIERLARGGEVKIPGAGESRSGSRFRAGAREDGVILPPPPPPPPRRG